MPTLIKVARTGNHTLMMLAVSLLSSIKRERTEMATLKSVRLSSVSQNGRDGYD